MLTWIYLATAVKNNFISTDLISTNYNSLKFNGTLLSNTERTRTELVADLSVYTYFSPTCYSLIPSFVAVLYYELHTQELHNLYFSPNMIRVIKSKRMIWAGHVARMGETRNAYRM
jgi:hypothetical protein